MCAGGPSLIELIKSQTSQGSEPSDYGVHPETGQERYPDRSYNEHSGYDYEAPPNEGQTNTGDPRKGDGLKGDTPLTDKKKEGSGGSGGSGDPYNY